MNWHQTELALFAVALGVVIAVAFVTTVDRVYTRRVSNDTPPGATGLAKPHPQLNRAAGEALPQGR